MNVRPRRISPVADEGPEASGRCKATTSQHLGGVIEGFSVGLVIPDLWQQEAIRTRARFEEPALVATFVAKLVLK